MKLSRNVILSIEILAAHKLRTILSVLGIVVGVGAVVLMVSAGRGAEKRILDRIRGMGANLVIVNAGKTSIVAGRQRQKLLIHHGDGLRLPLGLVIVVGKLVDDGSGADVHTVLLQG